MNEIITAVMLAAALAATFGIAYCFAWLCLRTLMALMPARQDAPKPASARPAARFVFSRRFALGQKH
jgi:peptidoglycan/LPS O-acetylase OafA/YrhL